ncbi:hypothetical protein GRI69_06795 [Erythrobacter vulgaris]|uniref:Uncharacterized protein n=1 Tax=Qipengyuania vulgaris TaxID=291985 RepID=A0A844XRG7_9SPHN|nr:hypothetical protein [Qipengyuania vulgaris]MXO47959.1 hypothetical protein [Qipengyuania vulgaris]
MIIAALTLLLAQSGAPEATSTPTEEDVARETAVIDEVFDEWQGGIYKKEDGKLTCRMKQSSGDQAVDLLRCGAMIGCYAPRAEELDTIAASDVSVEDRKAQMQEVMDEVQPCIEKAHREGRRRIAIVRAAE